VLAEADSFDEGIASSRSGSTLNQWRLEQHREKRECAASVPGLTAIANIKLNERHSLRRCKDRY